MADLRTARRTAEQLARDALGGTLLGAAGELLRGPARGAQVGHPGPSSLVSGCPPARRRAVVAVPARRRATSAIL